MRYRQVHLDFHTSEAIEGIGEHFSKENFQQALKIGHVDSITVFSKCHHGWAYHPSKANVMHPHLKFDLLGAQIAAAHEIGVKTPVYLSAGLDEKIARQHPDWLVRNRDESMLGEAGFDTPGYHHVCLNSPYLEILLAQIKEVCENYDADGIFLDIVGAKRCYCQNCIQTLLAEGKDPYDEKNIDALAERVYVNYANWVRQTIDSVKPGLPVFHNGSHIIRGRRDLARLNSHLELESLPTGGWGYDHFPLSAAYARTLGMDFLGMTGKFHKSWGEFGGFKHPNALRYEVALSAANGARCSIGDQLHPSGKMDLATYRLIGAAYEELEQKEQWLRGAEIIADVAVLSTEAIRGMEIGAGVVDTTDAGAARMLLEEHYLFDVIDLEADFEAYRVIILPDTITVDAALQARLERFCANGGKLLATGESGLNPEKTGFALDFGARYLGENEYQPSYFRPGFPMEEFDNTAFVMYEKGQKIELTTGRELGIRENPYFNREVFRFCSHQHTPTSGENAGSAMVEGAAGVYIAWNVFSDYAESGSLILRLMVKQALDQLLGEKKTLETNLPKQGVVTLMQSERGKICNLLYAAPVKRGSGFEVIEDILPVCGTDVYLRTNTEVKELLLLPQMEAIPFEKTADGVRFTIEKFACHQMVLAAEK